MRSGPMGEDGRRPSAPVLAPEKPPHSLKRRAMGKVMYFGRGILRGNTHHVGAAGRVPLPPPREPHPLPPRRAWPRRAWRLGRRGGDRGLPLTGDCDGGTISIVEAGFLI